MGCDDVKRVLYFFLDGTLGEKSRSDVDHHLEECPDCKRRSHVHRRLRVFVQQRIGRVAAPERFKTRLSRSLRAFVAEW